jgi:hypothetical protein
MSRPIAPGQLQQLQQDRLAQAGLRVQQRGDQPSAGTHQQWQVPQTVQDLTSVTDAQLVTYYVPINARQTQ